MSKVPELSAQNAKDQLAAFHVVDVREPHEFDGPLGHIAGATLAPLGALEQRVASLPNQRPILAVCRSGRRSERACEILAAHARDATNLAGGMIAWNRAGLAIERRPPASSAELRDAIAAWLAQLSGRPLAGVREEIARAMTDAGATWDAPSRAGIEAVIAHAETALAGESRPPDLDVSVAFFRECAATL